LRKSQAKGPAAASSQEELYSNRMRKQGFKNAEKESQKLTCDFEFLKSKIGQSRISEKKHVK